MPKRMTSALLTSGRSDSKAREVRLRALGFQTFFLHFSAEEFNAKIWETTSFQLTEIYAKI